MGPKVVKSCFTVSGRARPVHLFRHFCCGMYLVTMHISMSKQRAVYFFGVCISLSS